nr:MAG TPA: hypothetical protein [Caudoviricetes sp.]
MTPSRFPKTKSSPLRPSQNQIKRGRPHSCPPL